MGARKNLVTFGIIYLFKKSVQRVQHLLPLPCATPCLISLDFDLHRGRRLFPHNLVGQFFPIKLLSSPAASCTWIMRLITCDSSTRFFLCLPNPEDLPPHWSDVRLGDQNPAKALLSFRVARALFVALCVAFTTAL